MLCNRTSRYDVATAAINGGARHNPRVAVDAHVLASYFKHLAQTDKKYIYEHGQGKDWNLRNLIIGWRKFRSGWNLRYAFFCLKVHPGIYNNVV